MTIRDSITPELRRLARRVDNPTPILEAMGLQLASIGARSFNDASLRVAPWAPLKPGTLAGKIKAGKSSAILKRDTLLYRSLIRPDMVTGRRSVTIKIDRPYASYHQFGAPKQKIPARPFLPFIGTTEAAVLAPWAREKLRKIGQAKLDSLLSGG